MFDSKNVACIFGWGNGIILYMYEVELKVEVNTEEREKFLVQILERGFTQTENLVQNDYYVEAEKSEYGGYDLKRFRDESGTYFYTHKKWEVVDGYPVRNEDEREVTKEEFEVGISKEVKIHIQKNRMSLLGLYENREIKIDMDTIKFDRSPNIRYFIEAEIITPEKTEVKSIKEFLDTFLKVVLEKEEIIHSPGMFTMAFERR